MACMCGDTQCWSCGPAQGNFRCPICNEWADNGCEHLDEESGGVKPEFEQLAEERAAETKRQEDAYWAEYARDLEEAKKWR